MERELEGKIAVVTGASTGIGEAAAERLASEATITLSSVDYGEPSAG